MNAAVRELLAEALSSPVRELRRLSGGDINDAYAATLENGRRVFVKTRERAPRGMYACEAEGLTWLREANALRVPEVHYVSDDLLVLELIEARGRARDFDEQLGRGLAHLHKFGAASFGFSRDNFIAHLPQPNAPCTSWAEFYRAQRLEPLLERAARQGHVSASLRRKFAELFAKLPVLVGPDEPPARLHGDLWSGNVHVDERGAPVLIDPAVYGGHREIDLAMLQLFGAPSSRFFAAYDEVYPRAPGHKARVPLYQLYPLLVHVCLFGAGYVGQLTNAVAAATRGC